ncbi:GGDEF domain-containing protein [Photobacterium nomapromontoriensis]|uniref:GGDEF domain-containing protein n=1 Tax=Photobacterium nomapromontoriensis TaxID=2910237 RepID=UPI003D123CE3
MTQKLQRLIEELEIYLFFKICLFTFLIVTISYQAYNIMLINPLEKEIIANYNQLYSTSRRFSSFYNNANSVRRDKGTYINNNVSIMVRKHSDVKLLSTGIDLLHSELNTIAKNNIWTIAVFEHPANYSHFLPLRPSYAEAFNNYYHDSVMQRIMIDEKLKDTYQYFYGCNIKLSDAYHEDMTNEFIRTIYYPIYIKKRLFSLLAIDIKESQISDLISKFNTDNFTIINNYNSNNIKSSSFLLPCSDKDPIVIGISYIDIMQKTLVPSLMIAIMFNLFSRLMKRHGKSMKTDKMTNFYRRDYYEQRLNKMTTFSMLIIDIDHFKNINDTYGHKKGDEVISQLTRRVQSKIRNTDIAVRWGGEEFIICFNNISCSALYDKAEQIRESIANEPIAGLDVTISIGGISNTNTTFKNAYVCADAALYQSKFHGRNRVTIA